MDRPNTKKYGEKHPPDKKNKPKYVQKSKVQSQIQEKAMPLRQEKKYPQKQYKEYKKQHHKSKKQYTQRPEFINKKSSMEPSLNCLICSEFIKNRDPIWTCRQCCISLHLRCIKQWIRKTNPEKQGKKTLLFNWACIQCKNQYTQPIPDYYCFCGKFKDPQYDRDIEPHSCGQICQKKRGANCPHLCPERCHSGKCKPCEVEGLKASCYCGKTERSTKCSEDRPNFQCGKKCQKTLNCNKHKCEKNCHQGQCPPCKKKKLAICFCGKNEEVIGCDQVSFSCEDTCDKLLDCGFHKCEQNCHKGTCGTCQKTPELQTTCPCGRYTLMMITQIERTSCKDPIPSCGMPCKKILSCGHECPVMCHEGKCPECKVNVIQKCHCSTIDRKIQCFKAKATKQQFKCNTVCKKRRLCGQHNCNTECCPAKNSLFPEDHPCQLTCQRKLNCQRHTCDMPCHAGLCKKCPVIYSQPQPCPCGATSLKPPVVCGTITPQCGNICKKQMDCGHMCRQFCHYGKCRCFQQTQVLCRCGRQKIKTTCGREALCLNKCQKQLPCGHKCLIQCHSGKCTEMYKGPSCSKKCEKIRQDCGHKCKLICHPNKKCQEFTCEAQILIKCECGHRQKQVLCQSKGLNEKGNRMMKQILCNQKCENLKRFDAFYKGKQIYYPNAMIQFGFKNWNYLQKIEERLKKFILESDENFIEIDFKLDNISRVTLLNLFENHYHLNTHFYRHMKSASFTLMQTENTMIPNPILTQYIKKVSKGEIKRTNLPFEYTIKFESEPKQRTESILRNMKPFLHKYYTERKDKMVLIHFWSKEQALKALHVLQNNFVTMQFRGQQNIVQKQNKQEQQEICNQQIVETEAEAPKSGIKQKQIKEQKFIQKQQNQPNVIEVNQQKKEQKQTKQTQQIHQEGQQNVKEQKQKGKIIITNKVIKKPPIIFKPPNPFMIPHQYPPSSEFVQDIYQIDSDELFDEQVDWQKDIIDKFLNKKLGIQASQWRIRALVIISLFHPIKQEIFKDEFERINSMYDKDKKRAARILQIQKIDYKKVQQEMVGNQIYLSDHEPQILSYCILQDYFASDKVQILPTEECSETPEIQRVLSIIEQVQQFNIDEFYNSFQSADYVFSCALKPFVSEMRKLLVKQLAKLKKIPCGEIWQKLLFENEDELIQFFKASGLDVYKKYSKSQKEEFYRLKDESKLNQKIPVQLFEKSIIAKIQEKRDKKYFITQPQQLIKDKWMIRSFFAFGDFKQNQTKKYVHALARRLKDII